MIGFSKVCVPASGRALRGLRRTAFFALWCAAVSLGAGSFSMLAAAAGAEESGDGKSGDDNVTAIIIEKNLFSPERKKWVSEPPSQKSGAQAMAKAGINELSLLGTVVSGETRSAVLRSKKDEGKGVFRAYTQGDYVQGYLLKEIQDKKVVLLDDSDGKEYVIVINDQKTERTAEKTEIKPASQPAAAEAKPTEKPARKRRPRKVPGNMPQPPGDMPEAMKQALERPREQEE